MFSKLKALIIVMAVFTITVGVNVKGDTNIANIANTGYFDVDSVAYTFNDENELTKGFPGLTLSPDALFGVGTFDAPISGDPYGQSKPSVYDGREKGTVSSVTNQLSTGLCWDFSSLSAIESNLLINGKPLQILSQTNAAFALSNTVNPNGFQRKVTDGGNFMMAMAYVTRWEGPVLYSSDPFNESVVNKPRTAQENQKPAALHVQGFCSIKPDFDAVKTAVMQYGSVVSTIYVGGNEKIDNFQSGSHFCPDTQIANHQIQIVGWDNDYPASNFNTNPGMNGAWIVKNSWGTDYGDGGYLYVSYKDAQIIKSAAYTITDIGQVNNYDNVYLYDPFGQIGTLNYNNNVAWFANTFHAKSNKENLRAVSFFCPDNSESYVIYSGSSLSSLRQVASGTVINSGYYTIPLNTVFSLSGSDFTVAIKLTVDSGIASIPIETNIPNYVVTAESAPGQSFVSGNGNDWLDITKQFPNSNVCVRSFTSNN